MKSVNYWATWLVSIEIWPVAFLLAVGISATSLQPLALGIIVLFWPLRWLVKGRLSIRTPVDWPIAILILMVPITLWVTALPDITIPQIYRLLTGIAFFYALVNWCNSSVQYHYVILGTAVAGLMLSLLGLVSVQWTMGKVHFIPRTVYDWLPSLVSDTIHRNVMAGYLVILLPVGLAVLLFAFSRLRLWEKLVIGISVACMGTVLVLTQTRGAWVAFSVIVMLLIVLRWRYGWIAVPLSILTVLVAVYALGSDSITGFLFSDANVLDLDGRIEIWSRALFMIQDFPLTGIGMGLFGPIADKIYPFFLFPPDTIPHAHNLYLQVAVDLGIPGLISWLATLGGVVVTAWQVYRFGRRQDDAWIAGLGAGLLGSQMALMVQGLIDAVTWGMVRPAPLVWGVWGITVACWLVYVKPSFVPEIASSVEKGVPGIE